MTHCKNNFCANRFKKKFMPAKKFKASQDCQKIFNHYMPLLVSRMILLFWRITQSACNTRINLSATPKFIRSAFITRLRFSRKKKIVIALSTQLVRFLRGTSLSEVVFASKSSFYPAIHWDLSERLWNTSHVFGISTTPFQIPHAFASNARNHICAKHVCDTYQTLTQKTA